MGTLSQYHIVDEITGDYTGVVSLADSDEEL
jgi:hypothetical protein